ncbi:MAG: PspA/IM30 family protein [Nitrospinota bacterium]
MSIFGRLFRVGKSQVHSVIDKFEDPIRMTEQGIRELKDNLKESIQGLAQVKGLAIRTRREADDAKKILSDYERKAMLLLTKGKNGEIEQGEADRLASEALVKKDEYSGKAASLEKNAADFEGKAAMLQGNIDKLRATLSKYQNELTTLRARAKTAACMKKINEQHAKIDASGTISMLEKMKEKVEEDESLASAYGDIASVDNSIDGQIDKALASPSSGAAQPDVSSRLAELKSKIGA